MLRLKPYGATALSWLKNHKPFGKGRKLSLRLRLFSQPLGIICLSFTVILLIFNISINFFIDDQAKYALRRQFDSLDLLYSGDSTAESSSLDSNVFDTTYIIVNKANDVQYISASLYDLSENDISRKVTDHFYLEDDQWDFFDDDDDEDEEQDLADSWGQIVRLELEGETYLVEVKEYSGLLSDYYIKEASDSQSQDYYVFAFVNISPVRQFTFWINALLLSLFVLVGLLATLIIYLTSRQIELSFSRLKNYITRVGNRQEGHKPYLAYQEFNDVASTVEQMSQMIDANQRSQQIFFQNSSHELRTPLMSIQGYAEGIKEGVITDLEQAAQVIYEESQKMTDLVDEILSLSKLETTQASLQLEEISLKEMLYDLSWRLKAKADQRGIVFQHDLEEGDKILLLDDKLMERALINILSNAIRYAKTTISISTKQVGAQLLITIANDGQPIAKGDQDHIFERFYKGQGGHFGIGLAISKEIIERHQGQISVQSDQKQTVFTISLPIS